MAQNKVYRVRLFNPAASHDVSAIGDDERIRAYEWNIVKDKPGPKAAALAFAARYQFRSDKRVQVKDHGTYEIKVEYSYSAFDPDHEREGDELGRQLCVRCSTELDPGDPKSQHNICPSCWTPDDDALLEEPEAEEVVVFKADELVDWAQENSPLAPRIPGRIGSIAQGIKGHDGSTYYVRLDHAFDDAESKPGPLLEITPDGANGYLFKTDEGVAS